MQNYNWMMIKFKIRPDTWLHTINWWLAWMLEIYIIITMATLQKRRKQHSYIVVTLRWYRTKFAAADHIKVFKSSNFPSTISPIHFCYPLNFFRFSSFAFCAFIVWIFISLIQFFFIIICWSDAFFHSRSPFLAFLFLFFFSSLFHWYDTLNVCACASF